MSIRLGYQIPNFSYPGADPAEIFPTVVAQAQAAEAAGFDTVLVMDHFYQTARTRGARGADAGELPRKMEALEQRCQEAGRDRSTLETSFLAFAFIAEDGDEARSLHRAFLGERGLDLDALDDESRSAATDRHLVGSAEEVAEQVQARVLDAGIDGIIVNIVANGHEPGIVELAGEALRPLVAPTASRN